MRVVRPGGTLTVIEGDHGSTFFHPDSAKAQRDYINRLADHGLAGLGYGTGFAHQKVPKAAVEAARSRVTVRWLHRSRNRSFSARPPESRKMRPRDALIAITAMTTTARARTNTQNGRLRDLTIRKMRPSNEQRSACCSHPSPIS